MQRHNDVYKQPSAETLGKLKATRHVKWWSLVIAIISLALPMMACNLFNSSSRSTSGRIIIRTVLPTLSPTAIASLQSESDLEKPTVASSPPLLTPTFTPTGVDTVASSITENQSANKPPLLITLVVLNVRSGPGQAYAVIGQLAKGQSTQVAGRNPEGTWWQIEYPPGSNSLAWISADTQYSTVSNAEEILIAQVPLPPTATPTTVPTDTPNAQPTQVSEPVSNPTVQPTQVSEPVSNPTARPTVVLVMESNCADKICQ